MSQHDYDIADGSGAAVRTDLNNSLDAIVTQNSGPTAPPTTFSYQLWADTTSTRLKMRNGANTAWVIIGVLDATNLSLMPQTLFPNVNSAVSLTDEQLNKTAYFDSGTALVFYQAAAPTGWTKVTSHNDKALRVVSGSGGGNGGSTAFSTSFTHSHTDTFSSASHALTIAQMPSHVHGYTGTAGDGDPDGSADRGGQMYVRASELDYEGGGAAHSHTLSGAVTSKTIAPYYVDVIICTKN